MFHIWGTATSNNPATFHALKPSKVATLSHTDLFLCYCNYSSHRLMDKSDDLSSVFRQQMYTYLFGDFGPIVHVLHILRYSKRLLIGTLALDVFGWVVRFGTPVRVRITNVYMTLYCLYIQRDVCPPAAQGWQTTWRQRVYHSRCQLVQDMQRQWPR